MASPLFFILPVLGIISVATILYTMHGSCIGSKEEPPMPQFAPLPSQDDRPKPKPKKKERKIKKEDTSESEDDGYNDSSVNDDDDDDDIDDQSRYASSDNAGSAYLSYTSSPTMQEVESSNTCGLRRRMSNRTSSTATLKSAKEQTNKVKVVSSTTQTQPTSAMESIPPAHYYPPGLIHPMHYPLYHYQNPPPPPPCCCYNHNPHNRSYGLDTFRFPSCHSTASVCPSDSTCCTLGLVNPSYSGSSDLSSMSSSSPRSTDISDSERSTSSSYFSEGRESQVSSTESTGSSHSGTKSHRHHRCSRHHHKTSSVKSDKSSSSTHRHGYRTLDNDSNGDGGDDVTTSMGSVRHRRHRNHHHHHRDAVPKQEGSSCSICLDESSGARRRLVILKPCGHNGICKNCIEVMLDEGCLKCPVCRTPIKSYKRVV